MSPEEEAIRRDECLRLADSQERRREAYKKIIHDLMMKPLEEGETSTERDSHLLQLSHHVQFMVEEVIALRCMYPDPAKPT